MIRKALILSIMLLGVTTLGCSARGITPSKEMATNVVKLSPFDELKVSIPVTVNYEQTDVNEYSATITGPENIVPHIATRVSGDCLEIKLDKKIKVKGSMKVAITVRCPFLDEVDMSAASSFTAMNINVPSFDLDLSGASSANIGKLQTKNVDIDINGASNATFADIAANKIDADLSGASRLSMGGEVKKVEYEASGASIIQAANLKAKHGNVKASGASKVNASIVDARQHSSGASSIIISR